jgi:hypothetical protein
MTDLTTTAPSESRRGRGRPSYEQEDASLAVKLVQMSETGEARSIEAAARVMFRSAAGYGSSDSKVDRIARRAREYRRSLSPE